MRDQFIEGWVVVHFVVDTTGAVLRASIGVDSASRPDFVESAIDMLASARFRPGQLDGRPVTVCVQQTINWHIH